MAEMSTGKTTAGRREHYSLACCNRRELQPWQARRLS